MRTLLLKTWYSDVANVKKMSSQIGVYDDLIKSYKQSRDEIDPEIMKNFLIGATPKLSRQRQYMHKLENIFKNYLPHFVKNYPFYQQNNLLFRVLNTYQSLNIHRKKLFEIIESATVSLQNTPIRNLLFYYVGMVEMHHQLNPEFKTNIKNYLFQEVINAKFSEKYPTEPNHLLFATSMLNALLMDRNRDLKQAQVLLSFIEKTIFPTVKKVTFLDRNFLKSLISCREFIKLHKLTSSNTKFMNLLDSAVDFHIQQRVQSDRLVVEKQNYDISLNEQKDMQAKGSKKSFNLNVVGYGISSIFETKFQRKLEDIGYDFQKNVLIGLYEYDFLISGKKYKAYQPFENLKQDQPFKSISQEQWRTFKEMKDFNKIGIKEKWAQPIIINLNGPSHYIDSDVYGNERVTRTDEMKREILKNYGYNRFNDVHYAKWEEVDEKGVDVQKFIESILQGNKLST